MKITSIFRKIVAKAKQLFCSLTIQDWVKISNFLINEFGYTILDLLEKIF